LAGLVAMGLCLAALGFLWSFELPVIKNIWTSSFACLAAGYSFLFLGLFYWIIDIRGWKAWAFPLVLIGLNPITIYMVQNFVDFGAAAAWWTAGPAGKAGAYGAPLTGGVELAMKLLLLWVLYRRKIFLRL
jgi:predicted acyltransferase